MATGGVTSDLDEGDLLEPVIYELTPFIVREYCHGVEEEWARFHAPAADGSPQLMTPTLSHIEKIRILKHNCPGGTGPSARIHVEYHARHHAPIPVGSVLEVGGRITRRYWKRGREYLEMTLEVRDQNTGVLCTSYRDTWAVSYAGKTT